MELASKILSLDALKATFLNEPRPFTNKREVNWKKVKICCFSFFFVVVLGIFLMPSGQEEQTIFHEKIENGSSSSTVSDNDPTKETVRQLQDSQIGTSNVHTSLDYLYRSNSSSNTHGMGGSGSPDRNTSMILPRGGQDTKTRLTVGTRIKVSLLEDLVVSKQAVPIIGVVTKDVLSEHSLAIPSGSKLIGEASFNENLERATVSWRSIILPDGRERPLSALGIGKDSQEGITGNVRSEALKNSVGQTLTRFVGAYAAGSMNTGQLGANEGGHRNGLRNAIASTATDRANALGEDLQKESKWIELRRGSEMTAILNQPFIFRDPGGVDGG